MNNLFLMFFLDAHINQGVDVGENMKDGVCVPGLTPVVMDGINYDSISGYRVPDRLPSEQTNCPHIRKKHPGSKSHPYHTDEL